MKNGSAKPNLVKERVEVLIKPHEPPDGGFGWVVVFATFMQHVISLGVGYTIGVYYPSLQEDFGSDTSTTAWVGAAHLAMLFLSGPLAGWLVGKIGTAATSFLGSIICGLGCIGAAFAPSILYVILSLGALAGVGTGLMFLSAVTGVTRWFSSKRALATGLAVCGAGFGVFSFAPLIRMMITHYDRSGAMLIEGALAFNGCIFALLLRPVPTRLVVVRKKKTVEHVPLKVYVGAHKNANYDGSPYTSDSSNGALLSEESQPLHSIPTVTSLSRARRVSILPDILDMRTALRNWIFWIFAANQFLTFFSASAPLVFLYNRCVRDLNIDKLDAAFVLSIMGIFNTVGRLGFAALGNAVPRSRLYLLSANIMMYGAATAVSVFGDSYWSVCVHAAVFGTGYGCMFALTTVVLVDFFGVTIFGPLYGNIGIFRGIACLIGPPLGGWLVMEFGNNHSFLFLLTGILGFVGGFLLLLIPIGRRFEKGRRKQVVLEDREAYRVED